VLHERRKGKKLKTRVILVTDGDSIAQAAVAQACINLNLYPVLASGGNPTPLAGPGLAYEIRNAPFEPVVVMLDDRGKKGRGNGERALEYLLKSDEFDVLGVVAVASNTSTRRGVAVDESVDLGGMVTSRPVDKHGKPEPRGNRFLEGDTVEVLRRYPGIKVVGCGDLGKMGGRDNPDQGAAVTTRCLQELLDQSKKINRD
jgi:stage V sporulation protein AE